MNRLAIITTHPIQYNAPLFRLLQSRGKVDVKVFYTHGRSAFVERRDPGFGTVFKWDIPLLDGYDYEFQETIVRRFPGRPFLDVDSPKLIERVRLWGADAILVNTWNTHSHLRAMRYFKGKVPVYFRGESTLIDDPPGLSARKALRRIFLRWVYSHVDVALCIGTNNRGFYKALGFRDAQLVDAPYSVENDRFQEPHDEYERRAHDWRRNLGIGPDQIVFLFAGKFEPKKNPLILLEAFKRINRAAAHLILLGNGVLEPELRRAASGMQRVHFIGFQNQSMMPVAYRLGDVFVLPSQGPAETWGLAINEAMCCGRAIIASDRCGGAIDLIAPGENGFVFPHKNVSVLAEKLSWFAQNPTEIKRMGAASRSRIGGWTFEKSCEAIERLMCG